MHHIVLPKSSWIISMWPLFAMVKLMCRWKKVFWTHMLFQRSWANSLHLIQVYKSVHIKTQFTNFDPQRFLHLIFVNLHFEQKIRWQPRKLLNESWNIAWNFNNGTRRRRKKKWKHSKHSPSKTEKHKKFKSIPKCKNFFIFISTT